MNRPTVSAAIITLNEERRLPALLPRLAWADEIVVIDEIASHLECFAV